MNNSSIHLIEYLIAKGYLKSENIIDAFMSVDRKDFVLDKFVPEAYEDKPLPIEEGQTISQPSTVAFMLELLSPQKGEFILDVGSGSGWTTTLLAHVVGEKGKVFGLEILPELVKLGKRNLSKYNFPWAEIELASEDLGSMSNAPYDKILVSASANKRPDNLIEQLKNGGTLVLPIKNSVWQINKQSNGEIIEKEYYGFVFVPLIDV